MRIIKKMPVPICGLALALAALGNLLVTYNTALRYTLGALALLVLLLFTVRIFADFAAVKAELGTPLTLSVFSTYPMAWVLLAAYLRPFAGGVSMGVWVFGLVLHLFLILLFAKKYLLHWNIKTVFPTWFVLFVGFVVGSVTAPAMGMQAVGRVLFYVGFACYLILLPIMLYRVFKVKGIPQPATPTYAIFCAPISLCLAGYLSAFEDKIPALVYCMLALCLVSYVGVLVAMVKLLRLPFYPSYSAFTFPLVISAIAQKMSTAFLQGQGIAVPGVLVIITTLVAAAIVAYVLVRFAMFLLAKPKVQELKKAA